MTGLFTLVPLRNIVSSTYVHTGGRSTSKQASVQENKAPVLGNVLEGGFETTFQSISTSETKMNIQIQIDETHTAMSLGS
jgi:hypothetical protein